MSDLIKSLRQLSRPEPGYKFQSLQQTIMQDAANEIERLRAALANARDALQNPELTDDQLCHVVRHGPEDPVLFAEAWPKLVAEARRLYPAISGRE